MIPGDAVPARHFVPTVAALYGMRMLGLFMVMPVLALYAGEMPGATPATIGLALGLYGLSQALLQIPFGMLADRFGYRRLLLVGLSLFAIGSLVAALAETIYGVMLGRLLQGSGAVAGILLAGVGRWVSPRNQVPAYAVIGLTIGLSFVAALLLGPVLNRLVGLSGVFLFSTVLALPALLLVLRFFPAELPPTASLQPAVVDLLALLRRPQIRLLCFGVLILHLVLTAGFVVLPQLLVQRYEIAAADHWQVYLCVLGLAALMIAPVLVGGRRRSASLALLAIAGGVLTISELGIAVLPSGATWFLALLVCYFASFSLLESLLPVLFGQQAGALGRATAMGLYSTAQFLGSFLGGAGGGILAGLWGPSAVFVAGAGLVGLWSLLLAWRLRLAEYRSLPSA